MQRELSRPDSLLSAGLLDESRRQSLAFAVRQQPARDYTDVGMSRACFPCRTGRGGLSWYDVRWASELATLARSENIWVEISFVESQDTLAVAATHIAVARLLLGTHAPFFSPTVAMAKVRAAATEDERRAVAHDNALGLWGPAVTG